eukprot:NODE_655_length_5500_cov_0.608776.p1 type:complete len:791 gc:universal NODE_655_length_5500_cov_0.608776:2387-4759(+)
MSLPILATSNFPLNVQTAIQEYPSSEIDISTCYDFGILEDINAYFVLCNDYGYIIHNNILTLNHKEITAIQLTRITPNTLKDGYTHMLYICTNDIIYYYAYKYMSNQSLLIHQLPLPSPVLQLINFSQECIALSKNHELYKIGYHPSEGLLYRQFYISNISQSIIAMFIPNILNFPFSGTNGSICSLNHFFICHRFNLLELWSKSLLHSININSIPVLINDPIISILPGSNQFAIVTKSCNILFFDLVGSSMIVNDVNYTSFKLIHVQSHPTTIPHSPCLSAYGTVDSIYYTCQSLKSYNFQRLELVSQTRQWITHFQTLAVSITNCKLIIQNDPEICYQYAHELCHVNSTALFEYSAYLLNTPHGYVYGNKVISTPSSTKSDSSTPAIALSSANSIPSTPSIYSPPLVFMMTTLQGIYYYSIPNISNYVVNQFTNHDRIDFPLNPIITYSYLLATSFNMPLFPMGNELTKTHVLSRINNKNSVLNCLYLMIVDVVYNKPIWNSDNRISVPLSLYSVILESMLVLQRICTCHLNDSIITLINSTIEALYLIKYLYTIQLQKPVVVMHHQLFNGNHDFIVDLLPIIAHYNIHDVLRQYCPSIINISKYQLIKVNEYLENKQFQRALDVMLTIKQFDTIDIKYYMDEFINNNAISQGIIMMMHYNKDFKILFDLLTQLFQGEVKHVNAMQGHVAGTSNGSTGQMAPVVNINNILSLLYSNENEKFQFELNNYLYKNFINYLLMNTNPLTMEWFKQHLGNIKIMELYAKYLNMHHNYELASEYYYKVATANTR